MLLEEFGVRSEGFESRSGIAAEGVVRSNGSSGLILLDNAGIIRTL